MKCGQCGGEAPADSVFCPHCGGQLAGAANSPSPAQAAPVRTLASRMQPAGKTAGSKLAEQALWSGSYSAKAMIGWMIGVALLSIVVVIAVTIGGGTRDVWVWVVVGLLIMWGLLGLVVLYRKYTVRYELTTFRLFHETGLLRRTRDRIEVIDVDDVTLTQGIVERMLNVGTVKVLASDQSLSDKEPKSGGLGTLVMQGIDDPRRIADLIDNTRRQERERRAIFMENV